MSSRPPPKKPSGSRPNIRKLLSKDSLSSLASFSKHGREASLPEGRSSDNFSVRKTTRQQTVHPLNEEHVGMETKSPWMQEELVSSPVRAKEGQEDYFGDYAGTTNDPSVKLKVSKPHTHTESPLTTPYAGRSTISLNAELSRSVNSSPPPISPSPHWSNLRSHVLGSSAVASSPDPSFTSFSQLSLPTPVPSTPRPSRLARFGLQKLVYEAREAADDIAHRLADDLQKALAAIRSAEHKPAKPERDASLPNTQGPSRHLPFMSSMSLPLSGHPSSSNLAAPSSFKHGLRGVNSMAHLTAQTGSRAAALSSLQDVLARYTSMQEKLVYAILPHEREVLSTLLVAFLSQNSDHDVDDERQVSLETFETVVRRWKAPQPDGTIERCIWCCKAATVPTSNFRSRILHLLDNILSSEDNLMGSSLALTTILPSLTMIVSHCRSSSVSQTFSLVQNSSDLSFVHEIIERVMAGGYGRLDIDDLEQKYEALALKSDSENDLRHGLCIEAMTRCLEYGAPNQKRTILRTIEKYWPSPDFSKASTPLRSKVHLNKIIAFLRPVLSMLRDSVESSSLRLGALDFRMIIHLLTARVLPEMEGLTSSDDLLHGAQSLTVKVVMTLLGSEVDEEDADDTFTDTQHAEVREIILDWLNNSPSAWQETLHKESKEFASSAKWQIVVPIAYRMFPGLPESSRKSIMGLMMPQFQERLADDPPPPSFEPLSRLLSVFATMHPQVFYKPLFVCAASVKEETVARHLAILIALSQNMPNFWISDAEMMSVALISDPGGGSSFGKGKAKEGQSATWGKARLGQSVVLLELIGRIRAIREEQAVKQDAGMALGSSFAKVIKFVTALEARLAVLIDAKEQSVLLPLSQRILFSTLFLEVRLLMRSLKSVTWLPRIIAWTMKYGEESESGTTARSPLSEDLQDEVDELWERIGVVYSLTKTGMRPANQRRNTTVVSSRSEGSFPDGSSDARESMIDARQSLLEGLSKSLLCTLLEVLVAMSGALKAEDYNRLGVLVWDRCLGLTESKAVVHASFICMQCAEKMQGRFVGVLLARLQSPNAAIRRTTVQKLSVLTSLRFQLLSVTYITDRTYRRPFKLARPPLNFVATDVGDSKYIPDEDPEELTGGKGQALPLDIRRRLNEIGWDDEEKPVDQQLIWRRTPMSLLGGSQLDEISSTDTVNDDRSMSDHSPSPSPTAGSGNSPSLSTKGESELLRRNSSSHGRAGKRRPVFVQPLVAVFVPLARLALDSDFSVASVARDLLFDYMRDDPAVLCRPVLDIFSGNVEAIDNAISTLRTFLHLSKLLPPRLTHHCFNHLAGFLKFLAKDPSVPDRLRDLALTVPVLARFAPQVSDMSVRAIRRGKIEVFLFPSGPLYFPESVPTGPMFPKGPELSVNPFESCPKSLVNLIMIRMSQNLLFVDLLKRRPQDVHIIRKNWTPFVLPEVIDYIDSSDPIPHRSAKKHVPERSKTSFRLSLSLARTHLLFVAQVFRCLTRHLNSREELTMFLDGANSILLRHGDDIGIVAHSLIIYMIASTRFRRLMSSGTGFTLFFPVLFKVYCEAEGDSGVREAIEYAVHRFFAVHEEVFVYQALQVVSNMAAQSSADGEWISTSAYHLLSTLKSTSISSDAAGIREANRTQEEETALAITADERPQMFLASLRKDSRGRTEKLQTSLSVEIFDSKRFHPDNIIRMLLTVIAHDPTVRRAQYFVHLFRYLVPYLYDASSSARSVLKEAVEALGSIIGSKLNKVAKAAETTPVKPKSSDEEMFKENTAASYRMFGNPSSLCDMRVMRSDYLLIFASYVRCGGAHRDAGLHKALDIAKIILRETSASPESIDSVRLFLEQIAGSFVKRQDIKYAVTLLKEFAPIISAHGTILDLSGLFKSLVALCNIPAFANEKKFSNVVVTQICSAALYTCELAAQENTLVSLKFLPSLVTLLAHSVCLFGSDVIAELERRDPSPAFLCGVILPFIFQLRTTAELATETQWTDSWRQDAHARAWVRLLSCAMSAFQSEQVASSRSLRGSLRRSSSFTTDTTDGFVEVESETLRGTVRKAKRRPSGQSTITASVRLTMAFITLKAVVLRGEDDISTAFPGAWLRAGALLRSMLRDGNAMFALRIRAPSVPPSPAFSPMSSTTFSELIDKPSGKKHKRNSSSTSDVYLAAPSQGSRPPSPAPLSRSNSAQQFPCPRFVDYLAWSLLEFLCLRRSPLSIQLRTFMNEKVVPLNEFLQGDESNLGHTDFRASMRRKSTRPISTMYSKPRFRPGSAATTPEASPRLGPSSPKVPFQGHFPNLLSTPRLTDARDTLPFPVTARGIEKVAIHQLAISAPLANSFLSPSFVPISNSTESQLSQAYAVDNVGQVDMAMDARQALASTILRSPGLVYRTYERVRVVQRCLGYNTFLPIPKALKGSVNAVPSKSGIFNFSSGGMKRNSANDAPHTSPIFNVEDEPEVRVWTKRRAAMHLMQEARDVLHVWQVESAISVSGSDGVHRDVVVAEGDLDYSNTSTTEAVQG